VSLEGSVLLITGIVAGVVGSGGGITSLVSYPALLAVGIPPLPANLVNLVAGATIGPGSAISSRRELANAGPILRRLLPTAAVGSVLGSVLLLTTPAGMFARMVPFLVVAGSVVLLAQPTLMKLRERVLVGAAPFRTVLLVGAVSIYGGYFGAGSGVMLLAVVLVLVDQRIPPANAIKNMLVGAASLAAATVFVVGGEVQWHAVLPLAGGLLVGSAFGPIVVRHLPPDLVRWLAAAFGFLFAGYLWLRPA
jgi:uncharacterized membrane protein YfcA